MSRSEPEGALSGARILVVEDDFRISTELDTILADAGATVLGPFRTLAQAERAIEDNNVSAAILDFRLGDTTALPLAAQLRRHGIPFVFFTGQSNTGQIATIDLTSPKSVSHVPGQVSAMSPG